MSGNKRRPVAEPRGADRSDRLQNPVNAMVVHAPRRVIQICQGPNTTWPLYALCDDGSIWMASFGPDPEFGGTKHKWRPVAEIPPGLQVRLDMDGSIKESA